MNYVFDACALIALLDEEKGADIVQGIIAKAIDGDVAVYMSVINYTEVYYDRLKIGGIDKAQIFLDRLSCLPITIVFVTSDHKGMEPVAVSEPIPFVWLPARPKK
jgi:uncharacterized protein with PIN domain